MSTLPTLDSPRVPGSCPHCGAPLNESATPGARTASDATRVRSGEYVFVLDIDLRDGSLGAKMRRASFADAETYALAVRCRFPQARFFIDAYDAAGRLLRAYEFVDNRSVTGGAWRVLFDYESSNGEGCP